MKIIFRVDSGLHIGFGHVMRCMTFARHLKKSGHDVRFLTRDHIGNISDIIKQEFSCILLEGGVQDIGVCKDGDYSTWLLTTMEQEVEDFNRVVTDIDGCDLAIIDHYSLDFRFEKSIKTKKIFVIDDLLRGHHCDYLLDQNISANLDIYRKLNTKKMCRYFIGPEYALLREEFSKYRPQSTKVFRDKKQILAFFGGSDITSECRKVVDALVSLDVDVSLNVILAETHRDYTHIYQAVRNDSRINLYSFIDNIALLMSQVDVCFGAAGSTSWERACLGVPSFIVTVAENQKKIATSLRNQNVSYYVGDANQLTSGDWKSVFCMLENSDLLTNMSRNSLAICDGLGVSRLMREVDDDQA